VAQLLPAWALAACNAALVRCEIISRSCSATAARIWTVSRFAIGISHATNSIPLSIRVAMNATLRDSRSNLAIMRVAPEPLTCLHIASRHRVANVLQFYLTRVFEC